MECRVTYTLEGKSASRVLTQIEQAAIAAGYGIERVGRHTFLQRGEQRIDLSDVNEYRLRIRVDDPVKLPYSRASETGLMLGRLVIPISAASMIRSGRERHDDGSTSWAGEWFVYGAEASAVCSEIHDALVGQGLRSNGVWPPSKGEPTWKVELYSVERLVQVRIVENDNHLQVRVHLVDQRPDPP